MAQEILVGLDIGTTTISGAVVSLTDKKSIDFYTTANGSTISDEAPDFSHQDADYIYARAEEILSDIKSKYPNIRAIGITGQMHGVLYTDATGNAVSPFMIWQDKRADRKADGDMTYCDMIKELTGEKVAVGYGLATHYYNTQNGLVPKDAEYICNITDYLAMKLTGNSEPVMHSSIAASIGFFDIKTGTFKADKISQLKMDSVKLPCVTDDFEIYGEHEGIPVAVGIGDNQASFLGSVDDLDNSILVNIGTGSQISTTTTDCKRDNPELEIRPLYRGMNLLCGSAISGGASYAMLEKFFRAFMANATGNDEPQYDTVNKLAIDGYNKKVTPLNITTYFKGRRTNPNATGSITDITDKNFTPEQMVLGFIYGMCRELYDFLGDKSKSKTSIIASGNAVQKNPVFRWVLSDMFGMPVKLSQSKEEASIGAALFAGVASGALSDVNKFSQFINHNSEV